LIGEKESGAPYSERDHHLLNTLSGVAGMSLANMELSRKILEHERRSVVVDLAGGIAHEINNALYPLMGQAQWIDFTLANAPDTQASEKMSQPVRIIVDMCGRIKRIAENLNRLSAPVQIQKTPLNLNSVAEDAVQLLAETAGRIKRYQQNDPSAALQLRREFDPNIPAVLGDQAQLSQVFMNLLINAADAVESQGQGILTIGTRWNPEENCVMAFVEDTGPGIPHELLDKVFQPYFTTKPKGKGTGLGLAMVRSIVEAHGGQIKVHSQSGQGTRIEFLLQKAEPI
jgi:signal transduction histidine kinase